MLLDGIGSGQVADRVAAAMQAAGRPAIRVSAGSFMRPAGERFEWGREDVQAFRERWLDDAALRREVLDAASTGWVLPALWDAGRDRSARAAPVAVADNAVVLVDGLLLLGRGLPAELTVHIAMSPSALLRRGVPGWQLPAFADYDVDTRPGEVCDVLVRAEDPQRPAVLFRT